jgi:hypothetical protein
VTFAAPLLLALGALAAPVVALYLLKVRRRRVSVPYLRLWEQLVVESRARSLFQRLKRLYSLLLQLAILAAFVLAVSQPAFELASVKKESVVVLLDTSASMLATEGEEGLEAPRFERLLERARELVDGRSYEDEMLVAAVASRVEVLSPFSRNTLRLREALERARPTREALDAEAALTFARQVTADREHPVILFVSDGGGGALEALLAEDERARLVPVGEATENVGIVRFAARKNTSLGTDYVLAELRNFGSEPAEVRYELAVKQQGEALKTVKVMDAVLEPGEARSEDWQFSFDAGATLRFRVEAEGDRLALDDEAWAVVRPTRLRKVVLVAPDLGLAEPFKIAFSSMGEVLSADTFVTTTAAYPGLDAEARRADVTIVVDELPAVLPEGGNLILMNTPLPDFVPARIVGTDAEPVVWDWDREHLLNRYLNYRDLPLPPAKVLRLSQGEALVETFEGPLIAAFDLADRRVVYVTFDMLAELFPFRLAFPMLLRNSIAWFEVEEDVLIEDVYAPGDVIRPLRRVSVQQVHVTFLRDEERVTRTVPVRDQSFLFDETEEPGAYIVQVGGVPHPTTVNLFDPRESSIAPADPGDDGLEVEAGRHLLNRDLWAVLAALGLALWTLEWVTYHRRLTE